MEVHFLELPKLFEIENLSDVDDPTLEGLEFINAQSKEEIEVLAENNDNIKTTYKILKVVSKSKEARRAYEARQAEIMDQMTREKTAEERGIEKGIKKEKIENAKNFLLLGVDIETIAKGTGLSIKDIEMLKIN
ncbi:hypothetical protein psyc5s11_12640 [Clostridium gelidum]|uniref:PD-(D/E)XK nuclease family transposase n=1 Tax=Clostridium gelidum TaxID=704125 RepID=A0ABN6IXP2_9CLOT|nr:Rpn family recombination-promoting nuclease/putative transposase [Clostridium gelidum]BCZ45197.1 hypothetical protein psyc5s11_12640 [Clostridium gelidum]